VVTPRTLVVSPVLRASVVPSVRSMLPLPSGHCRGQAATGNQVTTLCRHAGGLGTDAMGFGLAHWLEIRAQMRRKRLF